MTDEKEKGFWALVIEKIAGLIFGAAKDKKKTRGKDQR